MSDANDQISDYLKYYCGFEHSPHFAVLIGGTWGAGKTHFVQKFLEQHSEIKHLYVSLYGVSSLAQIEDAFFQQLHPLLASKGAKIAGNFLKGLLHATVKVDIGKVASESFNLAIDDKALSGMLTDASGRVLIFDDLERCSIPIKDVMGYINRFVEHEAYKVIIIANESEMERRAHKTYLAIKEKLIGKTFEVQAAFDEALTYFLHQTKPNCRKFLEHLREDIREIFHKSTTNNLRIVQQAIWDFERFHSALTKQQRELEEAVASLLKLFFALSFEIRLGHLSGDQICLFGQQYWDGLLSEGKGSEESPFRRFAKTYNSVSAYEPSLTWQVWADILTKGIIDKKVGADVDEAGIYGG